MTIRYTFNKFSRHYGTSRMYDAHKHRAIRSGIGFQLTFNEWMSIWLESGKLHLRGRGSGTYVMGRNGDKGPYAIGNVRIISNSANVREYRTGRALTDSCKKKLSQKLRGLKRDDAFKKSVSKNKRGELNPGAKLNEKEVLIIFRSEEPLPVLSDRFNVGHNAVKNIKKKVSWKHLTKNL